MFKNTFTNIFNPIFPSGESSLTYIEKIIDLFGSNIVGYWPLNESSGSSITDVVNGRNGTYGGTPLYQNTLFGSETYHTNFNSLASGNLFSTSLANNFPSSEGMLSVFSKRNAWTDGVARTFASFSVNSNNLVYILRSAVNNQVQWQYKAGGVVKTIPIAANSNDWCEYGISWSKSSDIVQCYLNGESFYYPFTGLGSWTGTIANALISPANQMDGSLSHVLLINRPSTNSEMRKIVTMSKQTIYRVTIIGDSISSNTTGWTIWPHQVARSWQSGNTAFMNHAEIANTIIGNMATQVSASSFDDADLIIVALGANDNNSGDMSALQATIETQIALLKSSNPNATIYYLNVLPQWTDNTGITEIDKSNIRTAISSACSSVGVTCWDTYTIPWISAAQTSDGIHPTSTGHTAIYSEVLSRL